MSAPRMTDEEFELLVDGRSMLAGPGLGELIAEARRARTFEARLLESLKEVVDVVEGGHEVELLGHGDDDPCPVCVRARAAITKAEGTPGVGEKP